jgi:ABC-type branched-subunit amino acid transport system permease subunit
MKRALVPVAIVVLAALVPVCGGAYLTTFLFTLLLSYIVAQSWDWLHGEAGYVNLGHYIYLGIGAYAFALANVNSVPVAISFVIAALFTGLAAALLSFPLFRLRGDYFAFATLALLPLFELLAGNLTDITRGVDGILLPPSTAISTASTSRCTPTSSPSPPRSQCSCSASGSAAPRSASRSRRSATTSRQPRWSASASFRPSSRQ